MTDELHEHAMARREKTMALIREAYEKITQIDWINPNDYPVYLDRHSAELLRAIERKSRELSRKHDKAEEGLKAAARRVA